MKEKLLWSLVFLLGLMLLAAHAQSPRSDAQLGRYQVVTLPGTVNELGQAFRIDTVTGKTWFKVTAGKSGWVVLPDYPEPIQTK